VLQNEPGIFSFQHPSDSSVSVKLRESLLTKFSRNQ
jgi:hypothetical protein